MKMPPLKLKTRTGLTAGVLAVLALVSGCSPSVPPPAAGLTSPAALAASKSNGVIRAIGTNIALIETNSIFDDKIKNARDPFFPASTRLEPQPVKVISETPGAPVAPKPAELALVLNGIMGRAGQRIALINGRTFAAGDEVLIRATNGQARVRCLEIGPQSVTVTVNGKPEHRKLVLKK